MLETIGRSYIVLAIVVGVGAAAMLALRALHSKVEETRHTEKDTMLERDRRNRNAADWGMIVWPDHIVKGPLKGPTEEDEIERARRLRG